MMYNSSNKAFTLIELSIVLIIISLIVGGVVSGKSLIRSAELKTVISEYNTYLTAYNNFLLQYDDIPGDMVNASEYWPGVAVDGNGNRKIAYINGEEGLNAWHHLSLAGLVNGNYVGGDGGYNWSYVTGITIPASKKKGKGWVIVDTGVLHGKQGNAIGFMSPTLWPGGGPNYYPWGPALITRDAVSIDKKMDDGDPRDGRLYLGNGPSQWNPTCLNNTTGVLTLTNTNDGCGLVFWLD